MYILLFTQEQNEKETVTIQAIFGEYKYLMKKVALGFFSDPYTAEDIVSLALFKLRNHTQKFSHIPSKSAQSHIVRTVKSVAIDYKRKITRNPNLSIEQLLEEQGVEFESDMASVESSVLLNDTIDNIKTALEGLNKRQYDAVIYHKYFGLTLRETAEKMHVPSTSTVQSLCNSRLSKLRDTMIKGGNSIAK